VSISITSLVGDEQVTNRVVDLMVAGIEKYLLLRGIHDGEVVSDMHIVWHSGPVEPGESFLGS